MNIEEDYKKESYVKNDESLYIGKSENINLIQWLISILYIIVLYGWAYFDISANETMRESSPFILINIVYFIIFLLLLILQIKAVNSAVKMNDIDYCINICVFLKYSLFPFTLSVGLTLIVIVLGGMVGTVVFMVVPATIFMTPLWIAAVCIAFVLVVFIYCIVFSPSFLAFKYIISVEKKEYGMKENKILLHYLSQLVPVIDIIDILYLSNKYRKRGRLLSIITAACVFIFVVIAIVAYIIRV